MPGTADSVGRAPRRLRGTLRSLAFRSPLYPLTLGRNGPRQLFLVPADVWPGDAQKGAAMIAGRFAHQGETIEADLPLWTPGDGWAGDAGRASRV